jgi:glycosyltransferase involved in cell wall biosynthesis
MSEELKVKLARPQESDEIKVGIGALALSDPNIGGLNRYSWEISQALAARFPSCAVYTTFDSPARPFGAATRAVPWHIMRRSDFAGNGARLLWHQTALHGALRRDGVSVFFSPVPEGMLAPSCPQVVTVHDLLPLHFPDVYPRLRHYFRHILPRLLEASAAVVTDSVSTRSDIERRFPALHTPIHVVYPGYRNDVFVPAPPAEVERVKEVFSLGRFALAVGETRPYKNIHALVQAFARVPDRSLQLAIVGNPSRLDSGLRELPRRLGEQDRIRFLGTVSDRDLAALYTGAELFVFPSLFEGFGIPPLEAMACGCPVVASNAASIPEVCGDAAVYVEPQSADSITAAITRVAADAPLREALRRRGLSRAGAFSYEAAGDRIATILRECATHAAAAPTTTPASASTA